MKVSPHPLPIGERVKRASGGERKVGAEGTERAI